METIQTYQGQVRNGQPVIFGDAILPENASITVTVTKTATFSEPIKKGDDAVPDRRKVHREALAEFVKAISEIDDEQLDEEFDAIIAGGLSM